jgi:hypothetical protein
MLSVVGWKIIKERGCQLLNRLTICLNLKALDAPNPAGEPLIGLKLATEISLHFRDQGGLRYIKTVGMKTLPAKGLAPAVFIMALTAFMIDSMKTTANS